MGIKVIWAFVQILIGYNLVLPLILYFIYRVKYDGALAAIKPLYNAFKVTDNYDYGIIVTAYQQTTLIPAVVASLLCMKHQQFMIYVVADCCDIGDLNFNDPKVVVLRPPDPLKSNIRSHFYAINNFVRAHNLLTIIDSDNLVHPDYLNELNLYFEQGYLAVQGVRMAKNLNTTYACLDAARDIYYHFYDSKILFGLGSSSTLSGSGMAFTTDLYKRCLLPHINLNGAGFDKVLQTEIVKRNFRIGYAENAIIYDEKTTSSGQLINQRSRWINTWFKYSKYGFELLQKGLWSGKNQLLFGLILLRPPIFIFLILSLICLAVNLFINPVYSLFWLIGLLLFIVGFFLALSKSNTRNEIYQSLYNIPAFVFYQLLSLLKSGSANEKSVATWHFNQTTINEINK